MQKLASIHKITKSQKAFMKQIVKRKAIAAILSADFVIQSFRKAQRPLPQTIIGEIRL